MPPADGSRGGPGPPQSTAARPLSPDDLNILALESETVAGHTCKVITLAGPLDLASLRSSIAGRLQQAPLLGMRLNDVDGAPWWVPDPDLEVNAQVVAHASAGPLDEASLRTAVADIFRQHLDRSRPLWRIDVLPRLADGGSALIWRIHHALADGLAAMAMARAVLWDERTSSGTAAGLSGNGAGGAGAGSAGSGRGTGAPAGDVRRGPPGPAAQHRFGALRAIAREAPQPWLRSPLDGHIDGRRAVAFATVGLAELRSSAAAAAGATVNDAVLTVVAGGLRRWLESQHGHLGPVRVKVPVSLHGLSGGAEPGNRDSFFCLDLPLGTADPLERLVSIRSSTSVRKQDHDAQHLDAAMRQLARIPSLGRFAERLLAHPRSFALNVSNVPGPRQPVAVLGRPVRELHSLAEIGEYHALRICVVSLADTLNFGLVADPTLIGDVGELAAGLQAEAGALIELAR